MMLVDLFLPTLGSNATQIQFLLQHLYLQPEILKKCQDEMDMVVGHGRLPTLNDRQKYIHIESIPQFISPIFIYLTCSLSLPYIEACIRETFRHDTLIPSGIPHTATADTTFRTYNIPKVS